MHERPTLIRLNYIINEFISYRWWLNGRFNVSSDQRGKDTDKHNVSKWQNLIYLKLSTFIAGKLSKLPLSRAVLLTTVV